MSVNYFGKRNTQEYLLLANLCVGIGELVVCYVLGLPLILALERTKAVSRLAM